MTQISPDFDKKMNDLKSRHMTFAQPASEIQRHTLNSQRIAQVDRGPVWLTQP